ncbi:Tetraketide alpha-pyrone reductase 1 [Vitis vinifera]|uniref:Tetraketide alpha-pyrone reductase 1 n=1 Tax=Vitis vinifera TaxID=29760 RepID=A0A438GWM3_VITVI|nr:Tetraketide alpha-pyrone reductase 1 [Vitis vinifera]
MSGQGKVVCEWSFWVHSFMAGEALAPTWLYCQSNNNLTKTGHLLALDGAKERLHLFKADLVEEGSFDSVIEGCDGVFHTASPVAVEVSDPRFILQYYFHFNPAELIDPALRGTINILRSCAKVPSVKRVVVTSSMATVVFNGKSLTPDVLVDESWFSNPLLLEQSKLWYMLSKTLAEEAAWKFAKENGIDMVTLNPGWVIGPLSHPTPSLSVLSTSRLQTKVQCPIEASTSKRVEICLLQELKHFPIPPYTWVDVRDVANAHIQAYELLEASGRFCLVETVSDSSETLKILHKFYPALHISEKPADDTPYVPAFQVSQEKAKRLGYSLHSSGGVPQGYHRKLEGEQPHQFLIQFFGCHANKPLIN